MSGPDSPSPRQRPRAFRLDDDKVLVAAPDAPDAAEFRASGGVVIAPSVTQMHRAPVMVQWNPAEGLYTPVAEFTE